MLLYETGTSLLELVEALDEVVLVVVGRFTHLGERVLDECCRLFVIEATTTVIVKLVPDFFNTGVNNLISRLVNFLILDSRGLLIGHFVLASPNLLPLLLLLLDESQALENFALVPLHSVVFGLELVPTHLKLVNLSIDVAYLGHQVGLDSLNLFRDDQFMIPHEGGEVIPDGGHPGDLVHMLPSPGGQDLVLFVCC